MSSHYVFFSFYFFNKRKLINWIACLRSPNVSLSFDFSIPFRPRKITLLWFFKSVRAKKNRIPPNKIEISSIQQDELSIMDVFGICMQIIPFTKQWHVDFVNDSKEVKTLTHLGRLEHACMHVTACPEDYNENYYFP